MLPSKGGWYKVTYESSADPCVYLYLFRELHFRHRPWKTYICHVVCMDISTQWWHIKAMSCEVHWYHGNKQGENNINYYKHRNLTPINIAKVLLENVNFQIRRFGFSDIWNDCRYKHRENKLDRAGIDRTWDIYCLLCLI